jgi:predicted GNAT family acetyltransferase
MEIRHDKEAQKFYLVNEGKESNVLYRMHDKQTMEIFRTYVPPEQRKKGLAGRVVRALLDYAKENNLKIIPSCSYTEYFIDMNKQYEELIKSPSS